MTGDPTPGGTAGSGGHLRASFRVEPVGSCGVLDAGDRGYEVTRQEVCTDGRTPDCDCECRAEVRSETRTEFVAGEITDDCICPVFDRHDCVASIEGVAGTELIVSIATRERAVLSAIVADLRETGATVRLERIARADEPGAGRTIELDAEAITEKQREAAETAMEMGYYETPRGADLAALADELGISRSAVSQRLTAVESSLVAELAERRS